MYIETEKKDNSLIITLDIEDIGIKVLREIKENCSDDFDDFSSDSVMYDFFEEFIANSEWEWIAPEEIGALTSAPILGIRDEEDKIEIKQPELSNECNIFLPKLVECRSKWTSQFVNAAFNYDISPNITLGFMGQFPVGQLNAYRSTTWLGTFRAMF